MLLMIAAPWLLESYGLAQLTFILIYAIVGLGLMVLAGFTGLFSIGHGAFLGVGAYTQAVLAAHGWPFPFSLAAAAALSACVGAIVGLPALRVKGIYLGIATLSFGFHRGRSVGALGQRDRGQRWHAGCGGANVWLDGQQR